MPEGPEDQSLLLAIQTPHGSLLNIFQTKEPVQEMPQLGQDLFSNIKPATGNSSIIQDEEFSSMMAYLKERYHLVIDAESA